MRNFLSYLRENMLDSDRDVNYYNSLAQERMKLMAPKEPKYQNVFIGKISSTENLEEARTVGNLRASDQIHDPSKYDELTNEEAPKKSDIEKDHQLMSEYTDSIPHEDGEKNSVEKYTGKAYVPINQYLYGTTNEIHPEHASHIENLKSLIRKSVTPKPLTVFSGIKRDPREYKAENSMIHMQNPAFTSTSLAHSEAQGFATAFTHVDDEDNPILNTDNRIVNNKNIVSLNIPKGAHGYYADTHSYNGGEREFILHPGAKFHLWHMPMKFVDRNHKTTIFNHWYGRLVHDGIKDHPIPEDDPWHPKNLGI
jgi:hypothetical protein